MEKATKTEERPDDTTRKQGEMIQHDEQHGIDEDDEEFGCPKQPHAEEHRKTSKLTEPVEESSHANVQQYSADKSGHDQYEFSHPERGYMVMIVNDTFKYSEGRVGAVQDLQNINELSKKLGFRRYNYSNLSKPATERLLQRIQQTDHSKCDCFMFVISTHGDTIPNVKAGGKPDHALACADDQMIFTSSIVNMFNDKNCPSLINKPKLFIIQACRGTKNDHGTDVLVSIPVDPTDVLRRPKPAGDTKDKLYQSGDSVSSNLSMDKVDCKSNPGNSSTLPDPPYVTTAPTSYTLAVQPTSYTQAVQPTNYTQSVQPTSYTPAVQPTNYTPAVELTSYTPAVQPTNYTPAVQPTSYTPAVEPTSYTPAVQPTNYTPAVQRTTYTPAVQPTNYIPAVQATIRKVPVVKRIYESKPSPITNTSLRCDNDMLVMYATGEGSVGWRNEDDGSWMIHYLHKVFMEYDMEKPKNLLRLLTNVSDEMSRRTTDTIPDQYKAISVIEHRLSKHVTFQKKIVANDYSFYRLLNLSAHVNVI